jgi:hypothetical protein
MLVSLLGIQTTGHERQRLRRSPVEPLGVIDQAQHRPVLRGIRQPVQDRQAEKKRVRRTAGAFSERDAYRVSLGIGKQVKLLPGHLRAHLVQSREGELGLRFRPGAPDQHDVIGSRTGRQAAPSSRCQAHPGGAERLRPDRTSNSSWLSAARSRSRPRRDLVAVAVAARQYPRSAPSAAWYAEARSMLIPSSRWIVRSMFRHAISAGPLSKCTSPGRAMNGRHVTTFCGSGEWAAAGGRPLRLRESAGPAPPGRHRQARRRRWRGPRPDELASGFPE